ncbi:MAG TPA: hypothetical protein VFV26_04000, partial [Geothrix sp.]|nr:hypothetical protein [Geothrix sp.]
DKGEVTHASASHGRSEKKWPPWNGQDQRESGPIMDTLLPGSRETSNESNGDINIAIHTSEAIWLI